GGLPGAGTDRPDPRIGRGRAGGDLRERAEGGLPEGAGVLAAGHASLCRAVQLARLGRGVRAQPAALSGTGEAEVLAPTAAPGADPARAQAARGAAPGVG